MALSESEITTETVVVIPGELKLSNPVPPPITVSLPIVAWPNEVKNAWLGILILPNGLLCLLLAEVIAFVVVGPTLGADITDQSLRDGFAFLISLAALPFVFFCGAGLTGCALTCFWDAARSNPVLEITVDGLHDRRSGLTVPWSSVRRAKFLGGYNVDLELRGAVTNWQNPFRVGVLFHRYRPKPNHVIVSVAYLDTSAHIVAYTILTLTQRNGGEVISKLPSGLELYPRLIPQGAHSVARRMA
jgi:hypothetical protein